MSPFAMPERNQAAAVHMAELTETVPSLGICGGGGVNMGMDECLICRSK